MKSLRRIYIFRKLVKKIIIIIGVVLFAFLNTQAQAPRGEMRVVKVMENLDTLIIDRTLSDWWFGLSGGVSQVYSFGDLRYDERIIEPGIPYAPNKVDFKAGSGFGMTAGLYGEWLPIDKVLGVSLRVNLFDQRKIRSDAHPWSDTTNKIAKFESLYNLKYITFSPAMRINLAIENLYLTAGLDIDINTEKEILLYRHRLNPEPIVDEMKMPYEAETIRYGFNIGAGYDIFVADVYNYMRSYLSPYINLNIGTYEVTFNDSKRIPFIVRAGVNFKFNIDDKLYDTLELNPNHIEAPSYIATFRSEKGVDFPGFTTQPIIFAELKEVPEKERIVAKLDKEPEVRREESVKITQKAEPIKKITRINPNQTKIFYYPSSESATLTKTQRDYLDGLVEYMKENPNVNVRVTGHSDNAGTTVQNQQRSENRALNVVQYLTRNGIARRRIFDRGRGALEPVADNSTSNGRGKNRRVEIHIMK